VRRPRSSRVRPLRTSGARILPPTRPSRARALRTPTPIDHLGARRVPSMTLLAQPTQATEQVGRPYRQKLTLATLCDRDELGDIDAA